MFETAMFLELIEKAVRKCHKCSVEHGFWDNKDWNFGEKIALIHSELSEALEAHRKGNPLSDHDVCVIDPRHRTVEDPIGTRRLTGVEEELADAMIRIFDLCGKLEIDVGRAILAKMMFNEGREKLHGCAY